MTSNSCCKMGAGKPSSSVRARGSMETARWGVPIAILAVLPKCPACLVAYVTMWTGLGLSVTAAARLRISLLLMCSMLLLCLALTRLRRYLAAKGLRGDNFEFE